jgi:4-hydroxy-tetrahydrodipicolinate synthase
MNRDGTVDFHALEILVDDQISAGIDGLVSVGTTGESATLSNDEHLEVITHTVRFAAGRVPVIAGAGSNATDEALELSRASAKAGAAGLLQVCPYYNKPTQEGLYQHFTRVADATDLPTIVYNVPSRTSSDLANDTVLRLCEHPRIVAIKDATGDMRRGSELIERSGGALDVLSGDDFTALGLMALGGTGVISVVSNVYPASMAEMCRAAATENWKLARENHFQLMPMTRLLFQEPNPGPTKTALQILGKIGGHIRLPLLATSNSLHELLRNQLVVDGQLTAGSPLAGDSVVERALRT